MRTAKDIISEAIHEYNPVQVALMFSGGHDSLVSSHVSATILSEMDVPFVVYHGDTTIGIPETQEYVKSICNKYGWELVIRQPPKEEDRFESIVAKHGFPGATTTAHQMVYRKLKERALRHWVTHECKTSVYSREHAVLITGIRKDESRVRMGYINENNKEDSRVWSNPIFWWSKKKCEDYMSDNSLPRSPVKDAICISGECLCGCFAKKEEYNEIRAMYPHVADRIDELHELAKKNGHPWRWGTGPTDWYKNHPPDQLDMFMCVGCESKR